METFLGSCILVAYYHKLKNPLKVSVKVVRNSSNRLHWIWIEDGKPYEFYARGRSKLPYWKNLLYFGYVREIK